MIDVDGVADVCWWFFVMGEFFFFNQNRFTITHNLSHLENRKKIG